LETVKGYPRDNALLYLVKPARLSAERGLSIEDAASELYGLLAAVGGGHDGLQIRDDNLQRSHNGGGATTGQVAAMLFTFPLTSLMFGFYVEANGGKKSSNPSSYSLPIAG
jgi:hypothetical protein